MKLLPAPDEQEWILDELRGLISCRGFEPFVVAPVIEPTDDFFPDRYTGDLSSVHVMTRRLMDYAGLTSYEMDFETFVAKQRLEADEHGVLRERGHEGTAAWFAGLEGSRCFFGVSVQQFPEPDVLAATMSHEVAHAYRHIHKLVTEERDTEEMLTDITTVYLGLGLLTCNGAFRYRASGELVGGATITRWSTSQGGYLPPQALAFALAVQYLVRGSKWKALKRAERLLETNQGACFRAACQHLYENVPDLSTRLGVPDASTWPKATHTAPRAQQLARPEEKIDAIDGLFNRGYPVFRLRGSDPVGTALILSLVGILSGSLIMIVVDLALGTGPQSLYPTVGGIAFGLYGFQKGRRYVCSDIRCAAPVDETASTCPGCGGEVRGTIRNRREMTERMDEILGTDQPGAADLENEEPGSRPEGQN
jgi:hypothetical protein